MEDFFPICLFGVISHEDDYVMVQVDGTNGYMDYVDFCWWLWLELPLSAINMLHALCVRYYILVELALC